MGLSTAQPFASADSKTKARSRSTETHPQDKVQLQLLEDNSQVEGIYAQRYSHIR